ncbi:hypothetical protein ABIA69_004359 [Lysinibacillus parviboronicapiens]|uniref:Uncharacterized protein n=1 Tax=Lysinibacillus parviboronicapiens TaxID=436516 RepID=A0ABV2PQZ0_9BACI
MNAVFQQEQKQVKREMEIIQESFNRLEEGATQRRNENES